MAGTDRRCWIGCPGNSHPGRWLNSGEMIDFGLVLDLLGRSQVAKARGFDPRIPRFESWRPSQIAWISTQSGGFMEDAALRGE